MRFDQSWKGLYSGYETTLKDNDRFRFYYRGLTEAIHWAHPKRGIYAIHGSKEDNVVLARSRGCHNLALFIDANPDYLPD